ncbi:MAG: hypothetical protein GY856_51155 [bacterium]|nr:hypothetical protein [bacterium]
MSKATVGRLWAGGGQPTKEAWPEAVLKLSMGAGRYGISTVLLEGRGAVGVPGEPSLAWHCPSGSTLLVRLLEFFDGRVEFIVTATRVADSVGEFFDVGGQVVEVGELLKGASVVCEGFELVHDVGESTDRPSRLFDSVEHEKQVFGVLCETAQSRDAPRWAKVLEGVGQLT